MMTVVLAGAATLPASARSAEHSDAPPAPASPTALRPASIEVAPAIRSLVPQGAPAPRLMLVTNGADPALLATLNRVLAELGAEVAIVPLAPATAPAAASAPATIAPASVTAAVASAPAAPVAVPQPIAWEGQLRYRYETRTVLDYRLPGTFGRSATQSLGDRGDVSIMRTRVGGTLKLSPGVRGYFNLQDARTMGAEGSPSGTLANVDLFNAYVDLDSLGRRPLGLRLGRQVLLYGEGRLLSGSDWGNAGRGYDGARFRWTPGHVQADAFVTWINEGRLTGQDRVLSGLDLLWRGPRGLEAEAYHFRRNFGDAAWTSEAGTKGGLADATTGGRGRGALGALEWRTEGALQTGRRAGDPVHAWFAVARVTADLRSQWKTKLFVERMHSTGDANPTDRRFGRFEPLYWAGHSFQGALDVAGASNLDDLCGGLSAQPLRSCTVQGEWHAFTLADAHDAWVDDAGTTLRRNAAGTAGRALGREADATVRWDARSRVAVLVGASRFWRGSYVKNTGGGGDTSWGFAQLAVTF